MRISMTVFILVSIIDSKYMLGLSKNEIPDPSTKTN